MYAFVDVVKFEKYRNVIFLLARMQITSLYSKHDDFLTRKFLL